MKKIIPFIVLLIMTALISVSCKSTPQTTTEELNESIYRAQTARQRAIDFESPAYFPSDWEEIEAKYEAAGTLSVTDEEHRKNCVSFCSICRKNEGETKQAIEEYNALTEAYDEIFKKAVPLYAQAREDEILSSREAVVNSGFADYFPDYLKNADDLALAAKAQYEAEEYYEARDSAAKALDEFETLIIGSKVHIARQEIMDRGFTDYDAENFQRADDVTKAAINDYEAGNRDAAVAKAEEALLRYNLVLATGWTSYSADRQVSAGSERELAIADRANIASREIFREAEALYQQAQENMEAENFHDAAAHFTDSEAMFAIARQDTKERRQRAEAAIRHAEEKIEESSEAALEAERIIEGGTR
ncbi:MAG: hypothetical protein FWD26_01925 [Treponema sp.]|nr:hypothetical protein [Treponema sp.]